MFSIARRSVKNLLTRRTITPLAQRGFCAPESEEEVSFSDLAHMLENEKTLDASKASEYMIGFLSSGFSPEELQTHEPTIDELTKASYDLIKEISTAQELEAFAVFYRSFNTFHSREIWTQLKNKVIDLASSIEDETLFSIFTAIHQEGVNDPKTDKIILEEIASRRSQYTADLLVTSIQIRGMLDPETLTKEDETLIINSLDQISPSGIALLCNTIVGAQLPFDSFMDEALPIVKSNINSFDMSQIGDVLISFASMCPDTELFEISEEIIKQRKEELTPSVVLSIGQAFSFTGTASSELIELFDKTVGKNLSKVSADQICPLLAIFAQFDNVREKIFIAFHRKIKAHRHELSLSEKCHILGVFGRKHISYDFVPSLFAGEVEKNLSSLDSNSLINVLFGFSNPNLDHDYPVLKDILGHLEDCLDSLDDESAISILETLSTTKKGSIKLIEQLISRVSNADLQIDVAGHHILMKALIALNLSGADPSAYAPFFAPLTKLSTDLDLNTARIAHQIIIPYADSEAGIEAEISLRYQMDRFDENGELSPKFE